MQVIVMYGLDEDTELEKRGAQTQNPRPAPRGGGAREMRNGGELRRKPDKHDVTEA